MKPTLLIKCRLMCFEVMPGDSYARSLLPKCSRLTPDSTEQASPVTGHACNSVRRTCLRCTASFAVI